MIPENLKFDVKGNITVDEELCHACGLCASTCTGDILSLENKKIKVDQSQFLGCLGCAQCVAVCPTGAIKLNGKRLSPDKILPMPAIQDRTQYDQLYSLLLSRRSIRKYQDKEVDRDTIDKIINAIKTAPVGVTPSNVSLLVFDTKEKVHQLRLDMIKSLESSQWFFSKPSLTLMKLFQGKEKVLMLEKFVNPIMTLFLKKSKEGKDYFFYNAPLAIFFYTSEYHSNIDPIIAATYSMIAGESLGLGSCMLGFPAPAFAMDKKLREKYKLPDKITPGILVIFGYKDVKFLRTFQHELEEVRFAD